MALEHYQNLIVGSGEAGKFMAWTLAKQGQKTLVIERTKMGGACPNVACLPSKNVIHSAKIAALAREGVEFGLSLPAPRIDMAGVRRRKESMIAGLAELHANNFKSSGAEFVLGEARFAESHTLEVKLHDGGTRLLHGERIFLAVGTHAAIPDIPGLAEANPLTHVGALNLERLPEHLVVLGGGYVGLEFAQALRRFGSRVTVIQRGPRLLDREDPDVAEAIEDLMRSEGIDVVLRAEIAEVSGRSGERLRLKLRSGDEDRTIEATDLLVATGRTPNTGSLNAAAGGVDLDERGFIRVNERLETSAPGVWAMGECAGSPQFTHVSFDDFRIVRDNLAGGQRSTRGRLIPYCLFTDPELAHVGLTETEAQERGIEYRLARIPMAAVLRTRTLSQTRGFMKALIGADDRILGFTAFGAEASEPMAAVQVAMLAGLPYTALREGIFAHPTTAEGLGMLLSTPVTKVGAKAEHAMAAH